MGERMGRERGRPVHFWRHGFAPPPDPMPRVRVACVPRRRAASSATTTSWTSGPLNGAPNTSASSASVSEPPRTGASAIGAHLHGAALGPRHGAADEHQVLVRDQLHDRQPALGDAPPAHAARPADPLDPGAGPRGGAGRARGAHIVRAVGLGPGVEVVALDRALEALALGGARDLDLLADLERLHGHRVAHRELARVVAELLHGAQWRGAGLAQVAELALRERLLAHAVEPELDGLVAVHVLGADREHGTGARLEH